MLPIIQPVFGPEEEAAVLAVLRSGWVAQGPHVAEFERKVALRAGAKYAVAVTSATTGLHLALVAAGIGPGDEVIVPSLSFIASTNAVWMVGANPVFADVDEELPILTPETVAAVWTQKTRAVLAVHQLGIPCERDVLRAMCEERGARLIEDAACALGSLADGRPVTEGADLAVFSFHPRKVLTMGEGGAVTTDNADFAERLKRLRNHGMTVAADARHGNAVREGFAEPAWNYRLTDIQGAIGSVQMDRLDAILAERQRIWQGYRARLHAALPEIRLLTPQPHVQWNVQTGCVRIPDGKRDSVLKALNDGGIGARRGILAAHLEPAWAHWPRTQLPNSEAWAHDSLALPVFHGMTGAQQDEVVHALALALGYLETV